MHGDEAIPFVPCGVRDQKLNMASFNEQILQGSQRPNFFELLAQEAMQEALRPAFEYACKVGMMYAALLSGNSLLLVSFQINMYKVLALCIFIFASQTLCRKKGVMKY